MGIFQFPCCSPIKLLQSYPWPCSSQLQGLFYLPPIPMYATKPCSGSKHPSSFHPFMSATDIQKHYLGLPSGHTRLELWQLVFSFLFFITISLVSCPDRPAFRSLSPHPTSIPVNSTKSWSGPSFPSSCVPSNYPLLTHPSTISQPPRPRNPFYPKSPVVTPGRYSGM